MSQATTEQRDLLAARLVTLSSSEAFYSQLRGEVGHGLQLLQQTRALLVKAAVPSIFIAMLDEQIRRREQDKAAAANAITMIAAAAIERASQP